MQHTSFNMGGRKVSRFTLSNEEAAASDRFVQLFPSVSLETRV